jgi:GT2 family glycosyltransferase
MDTSLRPTLLQTCGLVETGDPCWPWQAVDDDPQFRFRPPPWRQGFRVTVRLELEMPGATPVIYLNSGDGYGPRQAVPMHALDDGLWQAECRPPAHLRAWRLDPIDRPGRFRLDELRIAPLPRRRDLPVWLRQAAAPLQATLERLRWRWSATDLVPAGDLRPARPDEDPTLPAGRGPGFVSTGHDPQWRLPAALPAGWYMLEMQLALPAARSVARLYPDEGTGSNEDSSLPLVLRSSQTAKRLVCLDRQTRLRIDPMAAAGGLRLERFRLSRVSEAFACQRMRRKLATHRRTRDWRQAGEAELRSHYEALFVALEPGQQVDYATWIREVETQRRPDAEAQRALTATWAWQPRFSVLLPTWNTPPALLRECLDSVLAQGYPHWELCIADDASTREDTREVLRDYATREPRIRVAWRDTNGHISAASNTALAMAHGDFVALLDHDDRLAPHALWQVAEALQHRPSAQVLYSDEDKISLDGLRCEPCLKPDWMPDLLRSQNYISHLGVYRRDLISAIGGFREGYEGSQDHDLVLRCVERIADPADIVHVPHVLYHWRMTAGSTALDRDAKGYASEAGRRAVQNHVDRCHPGVRVETVAPGLYRTHWPLPAQPPRVSLIIPTRDQHDLLRTCVESILHLTTYPDYELLIVDNQSSCPRTLAYLDEIAAAPGGRVRVLRWDAPFNYSAINNFAATQASGSVLGLVNNDIEVISPHWLDEMVAHVLRPDIGCVGAKLHYPDRTIQHAGVVLGLGGVANHLMRGLPSTSPGPFGRLWTTWNPSAVTAATLLLRRAVWDAVGGLDAAALPVAFNDVDLCLKVRALGLRNLWTPHAELIHHESVSRGADTSPAKRARFLGEVATMRQRWGALLDHDPAYHPDLTRLREDSSLAGPQEHVPHTAP